MTNRRLPVSAILAWLGIAAGLVVYFLPAPVNAPPDMMPIAGVVIVAVSLWATATLPEYFTAIIFFLLAMVLTDTAPATVFSGFGSTAIWMVFGGLVMGAAIQETGLGRTFATVFLRIFPPSYFGLLAGVTAVSAILTFFIPSNTGRIVIMLPITLAMADRLGFAVGRPGRIGLPLAAASGSIYPSFGLLPAAVPNLGWLGAAENIHGLEITYGEYFVANYPVLGLAPALAIPVLVRLLFPDRLDVPSGLVQTAASSQTQRRLALLLIAALGLWMTDFIHGVSPAWVALGAAILCMLPTVGVLPTRAMVEKISFAPWFFVAGVIGMGAMVADAGLGSYLGSHLAEANLFTKGADFSNFMLHTAIGWLVGLATTIPGQPAIMTTLVTDIAAVTGWSPRTVLMTQPLAWAMAPFAYQLPPWILAAHLAGVPVRTLFSFLVIMAGFAWIIQMPLQFLWLHVLGHFG